MYGSSAVGSTLSRIKGVSSGAMDEAAVRGVLEGLRRGRSAPTRLPGTLPNRDELRRCLDRSSGSGSGVELIVEKRVGIHAPQQRRREGAAQIALQIT